MNLNITGHKELNKMYYCTRIIPLLIQPPNYYELRTRLWIGYLFQMVINQHYIKWEDNT